WHPGVIGIVASRLVERHHRPVVVVSLEDDGSGRGSGRSIPGFDLLAALEACSEHLERFGGHRAAAGLQLRAGALDSFREAFAAHAAAVLGPEQPIRTERIDAFVGGAGFGLDLAEQLERLAPFGMGNPGVRLLAPSARIRDVRTMGEGKHCRFSLLSGGHKALGVAFGRSGIAAAASDEPVDVALRLDVNRWNGSVEPQVVLRELYPVEQVCRCPGEEWWGRFERELRLPLEPSSGLDPEALGRREVLRGGHGSSAAAIAELLSSGAEVLAVCADASRRAALAGLARFGEHFTRPACERCGGAVVENLRTPAVTDYLALERVPSLAREFSHVVLVDPPPSAHHERLVACPVDGWEEAEGHPGYLHEAWEETEVTAALAALEEQLARRPVLIAAYRDLREAGEASGEQLLEALRGSGPHPRGPEAAARCFRVLDELGLVQGAPEGGSGTVGVVSSEGTDLERSAAFRAYGARHQEALQYLERRNRT
ncbi:MAG TPA: DHHA1 domain-containing protein, partial [Solirubrobacterales bacterium]